MTTNFPSPPSRVPHYSPACFFYRLLFTTSCISIELCTNRPRQDRSRGLRPGRRHTWIPGRLVADGSGRDLKGVFESNESRSWQAPQRTLTTHCFCRPFPGSGRPRMRGSRRLHGTSQSKTSRARMRRKWRTWTRLRLMTTASTSALSSTSSPPPALPSVLGRQLLCRHESLGQARTISCSARMSLTSSHLCRYL